MEQQIITLENPLMKNIGLSRGRKPQAEPKHGLPHDFHIVSADGHWEIAEDIFFEGFPAHLKAKAPRVWFDRYWHIGFPDEQTTGGSEKFERIIEEGVTTGAWDLDVRRDHILAEGVKQEIVFPQSILGFVRLKDYEVQEWMYRSYNEYIARRSAEQSGRFYGVGVCSNWWDPSKAYDVIAQIKDLGLKTFVLPISPGQAPNGWEINYGDPLMDPLWAAAEEAGMPVNFHIGENVKLDGHGAFGAFTLQAMSPFRKPFGQLVFGGVLDRYPDLQIVFTEAGINWVASALQDAEMIYDSFDWMIDPKPQHRPSYYWHHNCYATFQTDKIGLELLDYIGADRVMWGADYPHPEGSFGYNWSAMQAVVDVAGPEKARKILGDTARELYKLD